MARTEAPTGTVLFTQQFDPEYWPYVDDATREVLGQYHAASQDAVDWRLCAKQLGEFIVWRMEQAGMPVSDAYAIVHDKDTREAFDEEGSSALEYKPAHIHMVVRFAEGQKFMLGKIAPAVGILSQYLEKPRGRYGFDNGLSYLTHSKDEKKYQYSPAEVQTIRGREYLEIDAERRPTWEGAGRAAVKKKAAQESVDELEELALTGQIFRGQIMLSDQWYGVYGRNRRRIDDALQTYGERRAYRAAEEMRRGEFKTVIVYIYAPADSGKSHAAKQIAQRYIMNHYEETGEQWEMYRTATNNPLDNWNGQEVLLLDDLRAAAMGATDWLQLLDPVNPNPAAARYKNKSDVAPRLILMTASIPPEQYFFYVKNKGGVDEAMDQFIRRLTYLVHVVRNPDESRLYSIERIARLDEPRDYRFRTATGAQESMTLNYGPVPPKGVTAWPELESFAADFSKIIDTVQGSRPALAGSSQTVLEIES